MCVTIEEIEEQLKDLPEYPKGLISMKDTEFHGVVSWNVKKGRMLSFPLLSHPSCEIFHTIFTPGSVVDWHTHGNESDEIIICLSGKVTLIFNDKSHHILNEMDRIEIDRNIKHMAIIGTNPCEIIAMTIPRENDKQ